MRNITSKISKSSNDKQIVSETSKIVDARTVFETDCFELLIKAYYAFHSQNNYLHEWSEPVYSANLFRNIKTIAKDKELPYFVRPEIPEMHNEYFEGVVKNTVKRYDIYIATFHNSEELCFTFEAKFLIEYDYMKKVSSTLISEYISESGMDKYVNKIYSEPGCMLAYVIQGKTENIVQNINSKLVNTGREPEILKNKHNLFGYEHCYETEHNTGNYKLKHIFLVFTN